MHKTHLARFIAAFVEGFLIGTVVLVLMMTLYGAARIVTWAYYTHLAEVTQVRVQAVEREKVGYEKIIVACLNRQYFVANNELFTCEAK